MATLLELCKIKHHAVRSDGAKFLDGERNDSLNTSWLTVNSSGRVTLGPGLYDELLVVKGEVSDDQIKTWANMGSPFFDPSPVVHDSQIPSAEEWNRKARTFYQATAPTATGIGDLWVDTDDNNHLYRWSGTAWVDVQDKSPIPDERIPSAEDWNRKARTFYQDTPPVASGVGDIWFDTSDHNHRYWWDGTKWADVSDTSPVDASQRPIHAQGLGGDIYFDKDGYRAVRKADGKIMMHFDLETGSNYWEGDGIFRGRVEANEGHFHGRVEAEEGYFRGDITGASGTFSGRVEAEEGYFRGDITGASGTFSGNLAAETVEYSNLKVAYAKVTSARAYINSNEYDNATITMATSPEEWNILDFGNVYWVNSVTQITITHNELTTLAGGALIQIGAGGSWSSTIDLSYAGYINANYLQYHNVGGYRLVAVIKKGDQNHVDFLLQAASLDDRPVDLKFRFKRHAIA